MIAIIVSVVVVFVLFIIGIIMLQVLEGKATVNQYVRLGDTLTLDTQLCECNPVQFQITFTALTSSTDIVERGDKLGFKCG
jgi:hypothetical protein